MVIKNPKSFGKFTGKCPSCDKFVNDKSICVCGVRFRKDGTSTYKKDEKEIQKNEKKEKATISDKESHEESHKESHEKATKINPEKEGNTDDEATYFG